MKKTHKNWNLAAGRIMNHDTNNSPCRGKNKHEMTNYMMVYEAVSHVTLRRMSEFPSVPKLVVYGEAELAF
jgi:hypothetical protein